MEKKYPLIVILFIAFMFISLDSNAQSSESNAQQRIDTSSISVYPNPVNSGQSSIFIKSKIAGTKTVKIFTALGKQLLFQVVYKDEIDISNLKSGIYILRIEGNNFTKTIKLVKK